MGGKIPEFVKNFFRFMELEFSVLSLQESVILSQINPSQNSPHPAFLNETFSKCPNLT
jgi:hypothetical protein